MTAEERLRNITCSLQDVDTLLYMDEDCQYVYFLKLTHSVVRILNLRAHIYVGIIAL